MSEHHGELEDAGKERRECQEIRSAGAYHLAVSVDEHDEHALADLVLGGLEECQG